MQLSPGHKLGPYEILAPIGEGGMGEVYKARDTRLDRSVAIKVSKTEFSERFEREARAISALNHPHICQLYDVGPNFLVMEFVEGRPLRGPLPIDKALEYAAQITSALDAAHTQKITHRDLKPANILVTNSAGVKLLDFGLAKIDRPVSIDDATLTMGLTAKGAILGTLQYMSPEQVNGIEAGPRSDIFSFGVVLYEMITGKRAFEGATAASVIGAILERPAPSIGDVAPPALDRVLKRCLEKDPENRWQTARDLRAALELVALASKPEAGLPEPGPIRWLWPTLAIAATLASLTFALLYFRQTPLPAARTNRFQILAPSDKAPLTSFFTMSPDGRNVAFLYQDQVWVHSLETGESRALTPGYGVPVWSPDSRFIAFVADGNLKKMEATGGPTQTVCALPGDWGAGSWNRDDVIIFGANPGAIFKVPATGGEPVPVTKVDPQERTHVEPWFLPDGRHFLYVRRGGQSAYTYYLGSLDAKPEEQSTKPLLTAVGHPAYAPSEDPRTGYLLFIREGTLMAQAFDNGKMELAGQPVPLAERVGHDIGWGAFSVSSNGVLVFQHDGTALNSQLTWFNRQGKAVGTVGDSAPYGGVRLSPDGTQVAAVRFGANQDIWLLDLARGTTIRFTTDPAEEGSPVWSPDGSRIAYQQRGSGIVVKPSKGAGTPEVVLKSPLDLFPSSWSRDGRFLLYTMTGSKTRSDIWVLPLDGDRKPAVVLNSEFTEDQPAFSPDGRWITYSSDESGKYEAYIRPFEPPSGNRAPVVGPARLISAGAADVGWRGDGKELLYGSGDGKFMAMEIATSPAFRTGAPHELFQVPKLVRAGDWTADGQRFLFAIAVAEDSPQPYSVVLNWMSLLKK